MRVIVCGVLSALLLATPAHAREPGRTVAGEARVIDGDTLAIGATKVRLSGLHAPELSEPGGPEARAWMIRATAGQTVTCVLDGTRTRDRWAGICSTSAGDLAAGLVAAGLGRDCPRYSRGRYAAMERPGAASLPLPAYCMKR